MGEARIVQHRLSLGRVTISNLLSAALRFALYRVLITEYYSKHALPTLDLNLTLCLNTEAEELDRKRKTGSGRENAGKAIIGVKRGCYESVVIEVSQFSLHGQLSY